MKYKSLGKPLILDGKLVSGVRATAVPLDILQTLRQYPIPVTIGGSNAVTFTLKGSTRPIPIWHENDLILLDEDLAYTWTAVSNKILTSAGADDTDVDSVLGVWYMYVAIRENSGGTAFVYEIRASQTAPEATQGPNGVTYLGHPGTSKEYPWRYVGPMICTTAATPVFKLMVKSGYWWKHAPTSFVIVTDTWQTPTGTVAADHVPKLAKYGLEIGGTLETGAGGQVFIGSHTASTIWDAELDISEATASNVAEQVLQSPVTFAPNDTNIFYGIAAPAGDFHLTRFKDVV